MFDLFGNIREQQEEAQRKLGEIIVEAQSDNGAIRIVMDANKRLQDVTVDVSKLDLSTSEQLEDLLVVTFNAAIEQAEVKAEAEMRKQIGNMLPGGLDQLLGG